jgi:nitroreductase
MKNLYNVIATRRSIRTFKKQGFNEAEIEKIEEIIKQNLVVETPYKSKIIPNFINQVSAESEKIGTYGFVKNAAAFIAGSIDNELTQIIDFGFVLELIVLQLYELNIGSVWLGGTFNRSTVRKYLTTDKLVPAVLAIGHPDDQSFGEKAIRMVVKASNRKSLTEIISLVGVTSISNKLEKVFEALRLAPSGSNQQPWRITLCPSYFELYLLRTPNYAKEFNYEMQGLDIGIALAHLKIALAYFQIDYDLVLNQTLDSKEPKILIATFKIKEAC